MKRSITLTGVVLASVIGLGALSFSLFVEPIHAQSAAVRPIPKSFGAFKGTALNYLIFEDAEGTLRLVEVDGARILKITRN